MGNGSLVRADVYNRKILSLIVTAVGRLGILRKLDRMAVLNVLDLAVLGSQRVGSGLTMVPMPRALLTFLMRIGTRGMALITCPWSGDGSPRPAEVLGRFRRSNCDSNT